MGNADVLCIGEDGHIEIETNCLPCCNEIETSCEINVEEDLHDEHEDCNNCSDLSLSSSFLTKRFSKLVNFENHTFSIALSNSFNKILSTNDRTYSQFNNNSIPFRLIPINSFISSTILRC